MGMTSPIIIVAGRDVSPDDRTRLDRAALQVVAKKGTYSRILEHVRAVTAARKNSAQQAKRVLEETGKNSAMMYPSSRVVL
jgi:hypothetical protein